MDCKKVIHYLLLTFFIFPEIILLVGCEIIDSDAPNYIEASNGNYTDYIYLQWELVTKAASYNLYYAESKNGHYTFVENTIFTSTTYNPFCDGYFYYFKVSYLDVDGKESDLSKADYGYTAIPADEYEIYGEDYKLQVFPGNPSKRRSIHSRTDVDWFTFNATEGKTYIIRTIYPENDKYSYTNQERWVPADTSLYLYPDNVDKPALTEITSNSDGGSPGGYSEITWLCNTSGIYYIKVIGDPDNSSPEGWYQLSIE